MVQEVTQLAQSAQFYVYNILIGVAILLIGFSLGFLSKKLFHRLFTEIKLNQILRKINFNQDVESALSWLIALSIYTITIILFLDRWGLKSYALYFILGAMIILVTLIVLVGIKDAIPNFRGWIALKKKGIKVGGRIEFQEIKGKVETVNYFITKVRTERGDLLYFPNSLFLNQTTNETVNKL